MHITLINVYKQNFSLYKRDDGNLPVDWCHWIQRYYSICSSFEERKSGEGVWWRYNNGCLPKCHGIILHTTVFLFAWMVLTVQKCAVKIQTKHFVQQKPVILLADKILHKIVTLENVDTEKYGRILADVMYNDEPVTKCLLDNHLAVEYHGGRKNCPDNWLEYFNSRSTS